jgi:hypothetical protein
MSRRSARNGSASFATFARACYLGEFPVGVPLLSWLHRLVTFLDLPFGSWLTQPYQPMDETLLRLLDGHVADDLHSNKVSINEAGVEAIIRSTCV